MLNSGHMTDVNLWSHDFDRQVDEVFFAWYKMS